MKSIQTLVTLMLVSSMTSVIAFADKPTSNTPDTGPGCFGNFSDIDTSVLDEGIVVSYISSVDGKGYLYSYGLMKVNNSWAPICPVVLPATAPDNLTITLTIPNTSVGPVFDSAEVDTELADGKMIPLQITSSSQLIKGSVIMTLQVSGFRTAVTASTTGNAILVARIFDSSKQPEDYLAKVVIPFTKNEVSQ